jgi:hypothetical protein
MEISVESIVVAAVFSVAVGVFFGITRRGGLAENRRASRSFRIEQGGAGEGWLPLRVSSS